MGNVITRRDYLVRQMKKEFPEKSIQEISQAVTELEYEDPKTNYDAPVFYDTGKPVSRKPKRINGKPKSSAKRKP